MANYIPNNVFGLTDTALININATPQLSTNPIYYVNSLIGNDANDGLTPSTPLATPTSKLGVTNATIAFYSLGTYRIGGITPTADGVVFDVYGPVSSCSTPLDGSIPLCANVPTIKGSDVISNWVNDGTGNNTFTTTFTVITNPTLTKVYVDAGVFETTPLIRTTSIALVRSTPGSFFISGGLLYIHLADNSNPNQHVIEASVRDFGFQLVTANAIVIRGLRIMHYNHAGILAWNSTYTQTSGGNNSIVERCIVYNNGLGETIVTPGTGDTLSGNIVYFTGNFSGTQTILNPIIRNNIVGRRDTESMVLNDHGGGITLMSATNGLIANNLVRTINGHGIVARKYFNGIMSKVRVVGNEVTKSQGHVYMISCTDSEFSYNNIHDGAGNCQFGSNLNQITSFNIVHDLVAAFPDGQGNNGLYNGFDDQSSTNTREFGNRIWKVSNCCSTHESDNGTGSSGIVYNNHYDSSANLLPNGNVPDTSNIVAPIYATLASVTAGLSGYGNVLIPNVAAGNLVAWWGAINAGDHGPIYNDAQFNNLYPGISISSYGVFKQTVGAQAAPSSTKTSAYTLVSSDYAIRVNASGGAITITLPASPTTNEIHLIKKVDSSANLVTISGNGHNIDATATQTLASQWQSYTVQYDTVAAVWSIY